MASDSDAGSATQDYPEISENRNPTLAESIIIATRPSHAVINKLITARVALAIPPHSPDSSSYVTGLLHIAPIYLAFEERWKIMLAENSVAEHEPATSSPRGLRQHSQGLVSLHSQAGPPPISPRVYAVLEKLYMPKIMRSKRLKEDISSLTGWPNYIVDEQLASAGQSGQLGEFILHMETAFKNKPHVLIAYAYILHMALFSGGRYMRATFQAAGDSFWQTPLSPIKPSQLPCRHASNHDETSGGLAKEIPFRFFNFETAEDGEDLKREFKQRLLDVENTWTDCERDDIIKEGLYVFEGVRSVIDQLDVVCASTEPLQAKGLAALRALARMINPPSSRPRDSVVVAKERGVRHSKAHNSGSEGHSETATTHGHHGHPGVSDGDDMSLCPAMSKSIRFEKPSPRPSHSTPDLSEAHPNLSGSLKTASRRLSGFQVPSWFLMIAFGVIMVGAVMSGRGS